MGLIIKEHTVTGTRRNDTVRTLYDTGAGLSCVRRDIAEILGETHTRPNPVRFMGFDGQEAPAAGWEGVMALIAPRSQGSRRLRYNRGVAQRADYGER